MLSSSGRGDSRLRDGQYRDGRNLSARFRLHQRFSTASYPFHKWVFDRLKLPNGAHVLELGCGFGALWNENRDRIPADWKVTLSDFSLGMLTEARTNLASVTNLRFEQVDAGAIPYRDACLDAVIANHMLYHVGDIAQTLREIRRVLKPGAALYATTIGENHMRELDIFGARFAGIAPLTRSAERFGLETGLAPLREVFGDVRREVLRGELRVTEAAPMVDYIRSMSSAREVPEERFAAMRRHIEDEIQVRGGIRIGTETGIFIASC